MPPTDEIQIPDEPLQESAPLARAWARSHCQSVAHGGHGCVWYHGPWQTLRLLGVFQSIRSDDDYFLPTLKRLIGAGARRILVSGAADYALLARIAAVAGVHRRALQVTVVDLCPTPLKLNVWYGEREGIDVRAVQGDVLSHQEHAAYDVICTHSFICFFDRDDRQRLVRHWRDCLVQGGCVVTAQRVRSGDTDPIIRYAPSDIDALVQRARVQAGRSPELGIDPDLAAEMARGYAQHHWTYLISTADELGSLFHSTGFDLKIFEPPGSTQVIADTPGTPNALGSVRWRILARRP